MISLPVHESLDCVVDQAKNLSAFAPEAVPVFHVSKQAPFTVRELEDLLASANPNAIVNSERLDTGWADGSMMRVHTSNFNYADSLVQMAYFALDASNTLLVRHGLSEHMLRHFSLEKPVAGYNLPKPSIECASAHAMHKDLNLQMCLGLSSRLMPEVGIVPCEGAWFDATMFKQALRVIQDGQWSGQYATEEVYPVVAWNFVARPESRVSGNYIMTPFEANLYVTKDDVEVIHHGEHRNKDLFGVKRVPREINHPIRKMIRELAGY